MLSTRNIKILFLLLISFLFYSCEKNNDEKRRFISSFETVDDFSGFYLTPQEYLGTSFHELSDSIVHTGVFSHRAWVLGANSASTSSINNNHRAYPTVQLYKQTGGSFITPCYISLWVWVDMELQESTSGEEDDWISFATFTDDESDDWDRTVLVNLSHDGYVHLQHVPRQGQQDYIFQTTDLVFPQKEWVELKIYLDFSYDGYAKVWQNGVLVSHAKVRNVKNQLSQAHFGLYCPPQIESGVIFNDDLIIEMVDGE